MTGLAHYADYADYTSSDSDMAIKYTYDAFNRQVDESSRRLRPADDLGRHKRAGNA